LFRIKIDWSDEYENASDSIRVKREFDSNTIHLSAPRFSPKPNRSIGWGQFRMIIEFGIQANRILVLLGPHCVTVLIEPPFTTTRRS
jgi:hypothetical protein